MDDLDRTHVWLLRTQQIRRTPAVRGGLEVDHRARRQTAVSVAVALAALLVLVVVPPRLRSSSPPPDVLHGQTAAAATVRTAARSERPTRANRAAVLLKPPATYRPAPPLPSTAPPVPTPPAAYLPPPGHVAPHVPLGLDGPVRVGR